MGQFLQPDFSKGDPNTLGGYRAAHGRPPAFEAADGGSYSVEILCDKIGEGDRRFGAYLFFVNWREHDPVAVAHVESDYVTYGPTEEAATSELAAWPLQKVRAELDRLTQAVARGNGARA